MRSPNRLRGSARPGRPWNDEFQWREAGLVHVLPSFLSIDERKDRRAATLERIEYGGVRYQLREPLTGEFQGCGSGIAFRVDSFLPIIGEGKDPRSAVQDFQRKVHIRLQRLFAMFEGAWTDADRRDWEILGDHLDLESYLRERPIRTYQRGEVLRADGDLWEVRWFDGRSERTDLRRMPDDFAALEAGDHFEAFVAIHPATKRLIAMYSVSSIEPPDESMTPADVWRQELDAAERVKLPRSTIDWTQ